MSKKELILRGIPVSPGIAMGRVFVFKRFVPNFRERLIPHNEVRNEISRFQKAIRETEQELKVLQEEIRQEMGADLAELISLQIALLNDPELIDGTINFIVNEKRNAEFAYSEILKKYLIPLNDAKTPFFKERLADVIDVSTRVMRNLSGEALPSIYEVSPGSILVAHDLLPSEAALLDRERIAGVATEVGGKTSHTAIMTKGKEIPAVVGVEHLMKSVSSVSSQVVLDGSRGLLILEPTEKRINFYKKELESIQRQRSYLATLKESESSTLDGKHIDVSANIEFVAETLTALENGARGIGLFRTEYLYLAKRGPVSEDEQAMIYADVADKMKPYPVIIRTFDFGGDKLIPGYFESNPFLGWRAIRLCFDNLELFLNQIRAILRAGTKGNVKLMLPMISSIEELRKAKLIIEQAKNELRNKGVQFDPNLEVGIMVETPACALLADQFAQECNFFSIGSNDLTQYTLAVDRDNDRVAKLYDHLHPAVLKLIKSTIDSAHKNGIWVGLCGEFASDPLGVIVLVGLGIDELSMVPFAIPIAKKIIRSIDFSIVKEIAQQILTLSTPKEVSDFIQENIKTKFPDLAKFLATVQSGNQA
ncbi:MAG: phosphoenolpyruvate--protein phosphotransferase [candidate division WOR-3 bacterium]|nr:phosphoenolpyruvate--protein phosphotransferase [candidate division WOR-3 bacterium]